jgi:hypothetical protein
LQEPGFERLIDEIGNAEAVLIGIPTQATPSCASEKAAIAPRSISATAWPMR